MQKILMKTLNRDVSIKHYFKGKFSVSKENSPKTTVTLIISKFKVFKKQPATAQILDRLIRKHFEYIAVPEKNLKKLRN